ncbi:MAG: uracil-DNA glycosylase family protein [Pirellulales bacterium]|nr:uracil-DNA glycosylase family protein [Pirellulales bacterium]
MLQEVRDCTICAEHLPLGPRPVLQIDPAACILIAGQAPGRRVHESGVPFSDASGDRLRDWLGVSSETFYDPKRFAILPMGFCYPGTGRNGDLPPRPECAPQWREKLLNRLKYLQLILVIGEFAQTYHMPDAGCSVTDRVQSWRDHWPDVVPLPHPSPRNNIWLKRNPWFEAELLPVLQTRVQEILGR